MSSARPGAGYITQNHRLFWKTNEKDFWAVTSLIMFIELDLASVMAKATQISFVRYHQGHVPNAVTVHNQVIFMYYPNVHILMRKNLESKNKSEQTDLMFRTDGLYSDSKRQAADRKSFCR